MFCRVDPLYAFFVQWSPDIYGGEDEINPAERGEGAFCLVSPRAVAGDCVINHKFSPKKDGFSERMDWLVLQAVISDVHFQF